jgi:RNA polymerase sigma-70 factor (ECF subfamily)
MIFRVTRSDHALLEAARSGDDRAVDELLCPRCSSACEALKRTVSLCRRLPGGEVPPAVRAAVRTAIHAVVSAARR